MTFTVDQVTAAMEAAVAAKGEDYVYPDGVCRYTQPGSAEPSCIVGHVIAALAPDLMPRLQKLEDDGDVAGAMELINPRPGFVSRAVQEAGLAGSFEVENVPLAKALDAAQGAQDMGAPWGRAISVYQDTLGFYYA